MEMRFWGVRGSIPTPGSQTLKVGGNTTCVSLQQEGYIFVFDAGTGIRELGRYLEDNERARWKGCVILTHYHWDHIQGLPFFTPAFRRKNRFHVYGEPKKGASIVEILSEQMQPPYFPVNLDALEGVLTFVELRTDLQIEILPGTYLSTIRLTHPNGDIGYRLDSAGGSFAKHVRGRARYIGKSVERKNPHRRALDTLFFPLPTECELTSALFCPQRFSYTNTTELSLSQKGLFTYWSAFQSFSL